MKTLTTLAIVAAAAAPYAVHAADAPMKPSGAIEAVMPNSDKAFFENAASANMFEIQSSKLALTKSSDPDVKAFAQKMITDHGEAGTKLEALAAQKNVTLPTQMARRHQHIYDALAKDKAGKDFDEDYKNKMVMSHKEAVSLFDQTSKKGQDADVKSFAAMMLPTLQMHGSEAQALNKK
jgi:putative membrane protein